MSLTEANNKLTYLLIAVQQGEPVTNESHDQVITEIVKPFVKRLADFGTLKGIDPIATEQLSETTRPMKNEAVEAFLAGYY